MLFVPYDPETGQYIDNKRWDNKRNDYRQSPNSKNVRQYKRLYAATEFASLKNVRRNIPAGVSGPNKHYQNRPQVEIHEIDDQGQVMKVHAAPPQYIYL